MIGEAGESPPPALSYDGVLPTAFNVRILMPQRHGGLGHPSKKSLSEMETMAESHTCQSENNDRAVLGPK